MTVKNDLKHANTKRSKIAVIYDKYSLFHRRMENKVKTVLVVDLLEKRMSINLMNKKREEFHLSVSLDSVNGGIAYRENHHARREMPSLLASILGVQRYKKPA